MNISVSSNARLHMGFLDLHGGLGRQFGSVGVSLSELQTSVTASLDTNAEQSKLSGQGADIDRALGYAEHVRAYCKSSAALHIDIHEAILPHAGLGSGTQMALSVGLAVNRLLGHNDTPETIARILGRGQRSAIGISCFKQGGLVIDGGRGPNSALPPTLLQTSFPAEWRFILMFDPNHIGVHGEEEIQAFRNLPMFSAASSAHLCRLVLMRLLPGIVEEDVSAFGAAVTEIQQIVGDHFAPVQGGRFASAGVSRFIEYFESNAAHGVGQSSWGPTGFAICANQQQAETLVRMAKQEINSDEIILKICKAMNSAGCLGELTSDRVVRSSYA